MERRTRMYGVRVAAVSAIFGAGFLCGSITQKNADADMGQIGSDIMKQAEGSGGVIGSAAKLGNAISNAERGERPAEESRGSQRGEGFTG